MAGEPVVCESTEISRANLITRIKNIKNFFMQRRRQSQMLQSSYLMGFFFCLITVSGSIYAVVAFLCMAYLDSIFELQMIDKFGQSLIIISLALLDRVFPLVDKVFPLVVRTIESISVPIKEKGRSIGMCSTTAYVTHAIKNKRCSNLNVELDNTLNESEAQTLLGVLKVSCPPGLKISYDPSKISEKLCKEINEALRFSAFKFARSACIVLQQGHNNSDHILSTLPQEILEKIYFQLYPFPGEDAEKQAHFGRYAASRPLHVMVRNREDSKKLFNASKDFTPAGLLIDHPNDDHKKQKLPMVMRYEGRPASDHENNKLLKSLLIWADEKRCFFRQSEQEDEQRDKKITRPFDIGK